MNTAAAATDRDLQLQSSSRIKRTLPSLAALIYPGLIWCAPAIAPVFLALSLAVPLIGFLIARGVDYQMHPRSRWIAFAVVAAPPLYTFLGGWLDFQHAVPFNGLHVWVVVWLTTACVTFWEQPLQRPVDGSQSAQLGYLPMAHGISAAVITCFAAAHLANHLGGLWGGERHIAVMHALRVVYRNPIVETVLLGCVAFQLLSGFLLLRRKLRRALDVIDSLQVASAIYLVLFFFSHLSAALKARHLRHIDTNWTWLTSNDFLTDPWTARLVPYYFLGVVALGIHGGVGIRRVMLNHGKSVQLADRMFYAATAGAVAVSAAIMTGLIRA